LGAHNADSILQATDRRDGLCVLVNVSDPELAIDIAETSRFVVHAVHENRDTVSAMRRAVDASGLYGRVSVSYASFREGCLPYAENLANLIVVMNSGSRISNEEILRVLAPYGVAYANAKRIVKSYPKEMDEWSHFRHNAEGNMVAEDTVVGPPRHVRWVTKPIFQRDHALTPGTTTMVTAGGYVFYIQDESPIGFGGLPGQWRLIARDAFNGKLLWKRDMGPWGDEAWSWWTGGHFARFNNPYHVKKRLVAAKDRVFVTLGFNSPVAALDSNTGETLVEYKGTEYADEMVYRDGTLYVSVNDRPQKPLPGVGFSIEPTKDSISEKKIEAIEAATGRVVWEAGPYVGVTTRKDRMRSMKRVELAASEKGVFLTDGEAVIGLDLETGAQRFKIPVEDLGVCSALYHKGLLLVGGGKVLTAIDVEAGQIQWQRPLTTIDRRDVSEIFCIDDLIWIGDEKNVTINALDVTTGVKLKALSVEQVLLNAGHHHRCYPNKSTTNYMITGRRAAEFTNYNTGEVTLHHWARGACRYGLMPANGLLYKLPDPCGCYIQAKLLGFFALGSEDSAKSFFEAKTPQTPLEKGPAYGAINHQASASKHGADWPTFRHDMLRSSSVKTRVPDQVKLIWDISLGSKLSSPVIAGGRVYVSALDDHKVHALDEKNGKVLWTHIAGGRVDSPPTIYEGIVLFGCRDGWVYCLRAADGELVWRFRAAPYERNIMACSQVESAWPVHGSVLVAGGVLYCTAGRNSFVDKGIYLYALDAATGKLLGKNAISEVQTRNYDKNKMQEDAPGANANILVSDGNDILMCARKLDFSVPLKTEANDYTFNTGNGRYLKVDTTFFNKLWYLRNPWVYGKSSGYMIAFDEHAAFSVSTLHGSTHNIYVPRGGNMSIIPDKKKLGEKDPGIKHMTTVKTGLTLRKMGSKSGWEKTDFPIGPFAMVVAEEKLLLSGFRDAIDPADPWANLEGRKNSALWILSKRNGEKLSEYPLEALPVRNGMAVADGQIFISVSNGRVLCLGETKAGREALSTCEREVR